MTFTNKSEQVFQDGNLIIAPGESITTEDEGRIEQFGGQYAWQFKADKGGDEDNEAELKEAGPSKGVRELRDGDYVEVDVEGKQSKKIGK